MLAGTPPCVRAARTPLTRRPCARIGTAAGAPEDAGAPEEVVALAEALPCCSRVLSACFEWASEDAMQRRLLSAPTSNTAQYLGAHLGDELLGATSGGPASLLRAACGGHPGVALASVRLLRRRLGWRQLAARQLKVCLTWRGAPTSLSTLNTLGPSMDLPFALVGWPCASARAARAALTRPGHHRRCVTSSSRKRSL